MIPSKTRLVRWYQRLRIIKYHYLSNREIVQGNPVLHQPVHFAGCGQVRFIGESHLGCYPSPYFLSGYIYIEARSPEAVVEFGPGVHINNNTIIISDGPGVYIGSKTMLGWNCEIIDSDFHSTHPDRHIEGPSKSGKVVIGENVLIGSNVKIFKGVRIGDNSVIANGAIVTRSIPANMLAFGNPIRAKHLYVPEKARDGAVRKIIASRGSLLTPASLDKEIDDASEPLDA